MTQSSDEIRNKILLELYKSEFSKEGERNIEKIKSKYGFENHEFRKITDRLSHDGYIKAFTMGGNYIITSYGILLAEELLLIPEEIVNPNLGARTTALDTFARAYEEKGSYADVHYEQICNEIDMDPKVYISNMKVLSDTGYIESTSQGCFKITFQGLDAIEDWRKQNSILDEYKHVEKLNPQARGKAFEKIFSRIIKSYGWESDDNVTTTHEELDIVFNKEREYYLVECKWEKNQ